MKLKQLKNFIADDRGVGEDVFRLALIVIIIAAVLAVLATVLSQVKEAGKSTAKGAEIAGKNIEKTAANLSGG